MNLQDYADALDEAASAVSDLDSLDELCAARGDVAEQRALGVIAASDPGLALARLWEQLRDAGDDADRMRTAFERELTGRGLWSATRRAFALVREHVARSRHPVPDRSAEADAATIAELVALARRGSPAGDKVAALGAEALALATTPDGTDGRDRALALLDDAHLEVGDDALGVIRVTLFDAQVHETMGEPEIARKLYREILQYGRTVEGAGYSIGWAALLLGRLEANMGHTFRAGLNFALAAQLGEAAGDRTLREQAATARAAR